MIRDSRVDTLMVPILQDFLKAFKIEVLGIEVYRQIISVPPREDLVPVTFFGPTLPCARLWVMVRFKVKDREEEYHAKYHVNEKNEVELEYFEPIVADLFPSEPPKEVEKKLLPDIAKAFIPVAIGKIIEWLMKMAIEVMKKGG